MRKLFFLIAALSCTLFACKKTYTPTNPTPDNYRMTSYSVVTSQYFPPSSLSIPTVVSENYSFVYDNSNRVSQMYFTSNDPAKVNTGTAQLAIKFAYSNDTIYKTSTNLTTTLLMEADTFVTNNSGQITNAYFPFEVHTFTYYGKLLATEMVTYRDSGTQVTLGLNYTSNNNDFLNRFFNGDLTLSIEDTGIRPDISPTNTTRDTVLSLPLTVTWTQVVDGKPTPLVTTHNGLNSYSDALTGYSENELAVYGVDANGVETRVVTVPAGYSAQQSYQIYDYLTNRQGDYLQLLSFTTYGVNIYNETHMLKSITSPYFSTNVTYTIDADSKVSTTTAVVRDSVLKNVTTSVYTVQWNTF